MPRLQFFAVWPGFQGDNRAGQLAGQDSLTAPGDVQERREATPASIATRRAIDFHEDEKIDEEAFKALIRACVQRRVKSLTRRKIEPSPSSCDNLSRLCDARVPNLNRLTALFNRRRISGYLPDRAATPIFRVA